MAHPSTLLLGLVMSLAVLSSGTATPPRHFTASAAPSPSLLTLMPLPLRAGVLADSPTAPRRLLSVLPTSTTGAANDNRAAAVKDATKTTAVLAQQQAATTATFVKGSATALKGVIASSTSNAKALVTDTAAAVKSRTPGAIVKVDQAAIKGQAADLKTYATTVVTR